MLGISFQLSCIIFSILLISVYFLKKRIVSLETKIYGKLIIANFVGLLLDIACYYVAKKTGDSTITVILCRLILIYLLTWISLITLYIFVISFNIHNQLIQENKNVKLFKIFGYITYIMAFIFCLVLPLKVVVSEGHIYSDGPAIRFSYFVALFCVLIWLIWLFMNYKKSNTKKYYPMFAYIFLGTIAIFIQYNSPWILILTPMETFVTFLMYFTIENPDMKLIEQLNVEKDRADKANSAKTDFLSSMSHEIRTPLNAIVGFSNSLLDKNLPNEAKEEIEDIIMASESLVDLVNGILDISKIEANKLEIINVEYNFKNIFDDLVSLTKARLGEKPLEIRTSCDSSIPDVLLGDSIRLKQIILNLLTNSVKYTKEGYVDFKVGSMITNDICRLVISVEDSGIGIKKENIDKLFTKFERLGVEKRDTIEGTGLGLAITKNLVELMNGKIYVQSEYSRGSRFTVIIDQKIVFGKSLNDLPHAKAKEEAKDINIDNQRILIVDDNKLNLKVASRLLQKYGNAVVTECDSGLECINIIKNGTTFDLILMDDMMPKMSGVETLNNLKMIPGFKIPTIALTANAISGMREKYINDGFDDYLSKPIELNELSRVLKKYLIEK